MICLSISFVFTAAGTPNTLEPKEVWSAYEKGTTNKVSDQGGAEYWIDQFELLLEQPTLSEQLRTRTLIELGALFGYIGKPTKAIETFERLYQEAVSRDDNEGKRVALMNLIGYKSMPQNKTDLTSTIDLFHEYHSVLTNPPAGVEKRWQLYLADSYFDMGKVYLENEEFDEKISSSERNDYYLKAVESFETFLNIGQFSHHSKADVLLNLGTAYEKMGRIEDAVDTFTSITTLPNSSLPPTYAMFRAIKARYPDSREGRIIPMEQVLEKFGPDNYTNAFKQELLFGYVDCKMWDKAVQIASQIIETEEGDDVNAYNMYLLATSLRRSGRLLDAKNVLEQLFEKYSHTVVAKTLSTREQQFLLNQLKKMTERLIDETLENMPATTTTILSDKKPDIENNKQKTLGNLPSITNKKAKNVGQIMTINPKPDVSENTNSREFTIKRNRGQRILKIVLAIIAISLIPFLTWKYWCRRSKGAYAGQRPT